MIRRNCLPLPVFYFFLSSGLVCGEVVLVSADRAPAPIVISADAAPAVRQAGEELARYLSQISGRKFEIQPAGDAVASPAIVLEATPSDGPLGAEGYEIETRDGRLILRAAAGRGLFHAVYGLLEDRFGCRWWSHNEEHVPQQPRLAVEGVRERVIPPFVIHDLFNREAQNTANRYALKCRGDSAIDFTGGHNLYPLLESYGKTHPEIYPADKNGARKPNNLHHCYLASGIVDGLVAALEAEVERRGGNVRDFIYFAGMGDWYGGMCQCDRCQAVYEEEAWTNADGKRKPAYTGTLLRMINETAARLEEKHPGIRVGTLAYMSLEAPPAVTKPRENVVIQIPRLRHCTVHAAETCEHNRDYLLNVKRWCELAPGRVHIWEYGTNFSNFLLPFPCVQSMSENLALYHKLGVAGVMIQGNYVSTGGDMTVLKNNVWRRIFSKPDGDWREVLNEFCAGYYGPAAGDVVRYVETLEASVRGESPIHADEFVKPLSKYLTPELIAELRTILDEALAKTAGTDDDPHYRRLRELMVGIEAAELWKPGPLEEQQGQLVRTDLGEYSFPRAEALVKYCRSASPSEWGDGRAYRMEFLKLHGGPIATLTNSQLRLKVAPVQNGRIGPIEFADREIIAQTSHNPASPTRIYRWTAEPTPSSAAMVGETGIANWGSSTQHFHHIDVKISGEQTLQLNGKLRSEAARTGTATVEVVTVYPWPNAETGRFEWRDREGAWQTVALKDNTASLVGLTAWRVQPPDANVTVIDQYVPVKKGLNELLDLGDDTVQGHYATAAYDEKSSQFKTTVRIDVRGITGDPPTTYVERTVTFSK